MESLNRMAVELVDEALDFATELDIDAFELDNGATVLDFGVEVDGGIEAGLLLAEIQTAGLATIQTSFDRVGGAPLAHVELATDQPELALLCAQKAGWEVSADGYEGLGSGPARALVAEEDLYQRVGYVDSSEFAVLTVEGETLPDEAVAAQVAERAGVDPSGVFLAAFRTASIGGSVTMAARAGELAAFRLVELGYDPTDILSIAASAPVPPVPEAETIAMARGNDALAYGGQVQLLVGESFEQFDEVVSTASASHGQPFADIFAAADWAFDAVDETLFAPAQATIDVVGGPTHVVGECDEALLAEGFGL
jgi:methenyltetrahydromethanopterin cyclohydrolase